MYRPQRMRLKESRESSAPDWSGGHDRSGRIPSRSAWDGLTIDDVNRQQVSMSWISSPIGNDNHRGSTCFHTCSYDSLTSRPPIRISCVGLGVWVRIPGNAMEHSVLIRRNVWVMVEKTWLCVVCGWDYALIHLKLLLRSRQVLINMNRWDKQEGNMVRMLVYNLLEVNTSLSSWLCSNECQTQCSIDRCAQNLHLHWQTL